jgi:hypothetical protein
MSTVKKSHECHGDGDCYEEEREQSYRSSPSEDCKAPFPEGGADTCAEERFQNW